MGKRKSRKGCVTFALYSFLIILALSIVVSVVQFVIDNPWIILPIFCTATPIALVVLFLFIDSKRSKAEREAIANQHILEQQDLQALSPDEFETYVAQIFISKGWKAKAVGKTGDGGVDVVMQKGDIKAVAQCKRYSEDNRIGVKEIREFDAVVHRSDAQRGYFVTTSSYTPQALDWAKQADDIILIDGDQIARLGAEARTLAEQPGDQPDRMTRNFRFAQQKVETYWAKSTGKLVIIGGAALLVILSLCGITLTVRSILAPPPPPPTVTLIPTDTPVPSPTPTVSTATSTKTNTATTAPSPTPTVTPGAAVATSAPASPVSTDTPLPTEIQASPTKTPLPPPTQAPPPTEDTNPYPGCPSRTCGSFGSCAAVHEYLDYCPQYWGSLDRDSDGVPCESLCG